MRVREGERRRERERVGTVWVYDMKVERDHQRAVVV